MIAAQPRDGRFPGAISAHFLYGADGTRILLYTEWTGAEAHQEAAEAGHHLKGARDPRRHHRAHGSPTEGDIALTTPCADRRRNPIVPRHQGRVPRSVGKKRSHRQWIKPFHSPGTVKI